MDLFDLKSDSVTHCPRIRVSVGPWGYGIQPLPNCRSGSKLVHYKLASPQRSRGVDTYARGPVETSSRTAIYHAIE